MTRRQHRLTYVHDDAGRSEATDRTDSGFWFDRKNGGDCTIRALAVLKGWSYQQARDHMIASCERAWQRGSFQAVVRKGGSHRTYDIHRYGMSKKQICGTHEAYTSAGLEWIPDAGTYEALAAKHGDVIVRYRTHVAAIVNDEVRDLFASHQTRSGRSKQAWGCWIDPTAKTTETTEPEPTPEPQPKSRRSKVDGCTASRLQRSGMSYPQIARELGAASVGAVWNAVNRHSDSCTSC